MLVLIDQRGSQELRDMVRFNSFNEFFCKYPCSNAFNYLYNIKRIRKYLSRRSIETLIHSFVSSRVDYCNSLLYGPLAYQLNKLPRVQNAAARLILQESKYCHVRPLLCNLHWLPVKFRIDFKIILLTYKAVNGLAAF